MQLTLRRGFGYAFDTGRGMRGMGDDTFGVDPAGFTDIGIVSSSPTEGIAPTSTYSQLIAQGVLPADAYQYDPAGAIAAGVDPSTLFPITAGAVTPGAALTPAELAAEQSRASSWLATIPGALTTASKIGLTAAQIATGVQSGGLKPSSTCPSGYLIAGSAQCAVGAGSTPIIAGVSNTTLAIAAVVFFGLMMMGGKRR